MIAFRTSQQRRRIRHLLAAAAVPVLGAVVVAAPSARAAATGDVRINEVVTTGNVDDSIELFNQGTGTVDISGWILKDDNDSAKFKIPAGTTLTPGGFRAFDVAPAFGLGSSDSARLYLADGSTLVDSFTWTQHSKPSWSRCPDGTGSFAQSAAVSLGAPNVCGAPAAATWPGGSSVGDADASNVFGTDLSGLYQEGVVMWGSQNSGKLWRLVPNGSGGWAPDTANGWASGKALHFPGGSGTPDNEGVTLTGSGSAAGGVFVSTERDAKSSGTSRLSVLRYDVTGSGSTLSATREWNLTSDLPAVDSNLGLEGITWIPDSALTAGGLKDTSTGAAYDPSRYGAHTGGVFFVGVEATGMVYGYVLLESGGYSRVTAFSTGMLAVMEVQYEPQTSRLWAVCDDTCHGQHRTLGITAAGTFGVTAVYNRPSGMPDYNNEGFTLAGADQCVGGTKPVYWSDDSDDNGHALRKGTVNC